MINPELRGHHNDYVAWTGDTKGLYQLKSRASSIGMLHIRCGVLSWVCMKRPCWQAATVAFRCPEMDRLVG